VEISLVFGFLASVACVPRDVPASTIAYTGMFVGGGFNFERLDFVGSPQYVGPLDLLPVAGAFAGDDYSSEYMIGLTQARLYSVNVLSGGATPIDSVSTPGNAARGMHWDPTSDRMFLVATDDACATSTLYRLDVADASTDEVGATPGCIVAFAVDADGHAFGIDQATDALVSIDTATGAATAIGPLGIHPHSLISGFDFDPESGLLYLFAIDDDAGARGQYLIDTALGSATFVASYDWSYVGLAFAPAPDAIMANGFDP